MNPSENKIANENKDYLLPLRKDIVIRRGGMLNSEETWILYDPVSDAYFRITEETYKVVSILTDKILREEFILKLGYIGLKLTKEKLSEVYNFLINSRLLQLEPGLTDKLILTSFNKLKRAKIKKMMASYLFLRIRLFNPDPFLEKTKDFVFAILNKWAVAIICILSVYGYIRLIMNWQVFGNNFVSSLSYSGFIKYGVLIILLKLFHEGAHAYTAKRFGIRVRSFGIGFIMFFPRFYTDITDSWNLCSKEKKALIDSGGILFEIIVGGLAAIVWSSVQYGILNTIAYYVIAITIINTILVNGNPLLKFDGYFILMDLLNVDNLQLDSANKIKHLWRKALFGLNGPQKECSTVRNIMYIVYGTLAFLYKIVLYTGIILMIYYMITKTIAVILIVIEIYVLILMPLFKEISEVYKMKDKIQRKYLTVSSASVLVLLFIFFCPLPWGTSIPFVVEPTESRIIYSQNPGYIEKITANNYSQVKKDQILIVMGNKLLKNELNRKEVDLKIAEEELEQALTSSETLAQANVKREEIVAIKDKIEQIRVKLDTLTIHSPINGEYMYNDKSVQESSWIGKGYSLGEVFSPDNFYVLAFATEDNIKHIKEKDTASLSFNNVLGSETGRVSDINTAAEKVWPYNPLLSVSGGPIEVIKKDERGEYITRNYYYPIKISINNKDKGLLGKTGVATIYSYRSIGMGVIKKGINIFYQEFSI